MTSSNGKGSRLYDYGPPRWLGALQNAKPRTAFMTGLLLLSVFPSVLIILVTVG